MPDQKPTIGRIVIYNRGSVQYPAVITKVFENNTVNLNVFADTLGLQVETSRTQGDEPYQWNWPKIEK